MNIIWMSISSLLIFIIVQLQTVANANRVTSKIYTDLDNRHFCFVRLNGTNQIGCASSENGNSGVVKVVESATDMDVIIKSGSDDPYVAVINSRDFNLTTLMAFKNKGGRVAGVLVLDRQRPHAFSSDRSCPNQMFSVYNDSEFGFCRHQKWNKPTDDHHDGIMFHHWPFPIFLLRKEAEIELLLNKTKEHQDWPKLAVQLVSPMFAAVDSRTCVRRSLDEANSWHSLTPQRFCDPLGGTNIYSHTINLTSTKEISPNSVMILATRLDSFSMFDGIAPGADSAVSSLIAVLAAAELLYREGENRKRLFHPKQEKSLLIALFDGESFDYIGSSQAAFQMKMGKFPLLPAHLVSDSKLQLNLSHLSDFIELDQVTHYGRDQPLEIHLHKHLNSNISYLVDLMDSESNGLLNITVKPTSPGRPLPPASVQSFLKLRMDDNFRAMVMANHEFAYVNKFYNSRYEEGHDIDPEYYLNRMEELATLVARVVFQLTTGYKMDSAARADSKIVQMLYECLLKTSSCELFNVVSSENRTTAPNEPPFPTYVSAYESPQILRHYIRAVFHYLIGEKLKNVNRDECSKLAGEDSTRFYLWQNGWNLTGECVRSSVYTDDAISPAFDTNTLAIDRTLIKDYAVWTESRWEYSSLKMFVVASPVQQWLTFLLGLIVLILSLTVVAYLSQHSERYFDRPLATAMESPNDSLVANAATPAGTGSIRGSEDYPNWVRSPTEIEYAGITTAERSNSHQVFT